MVWSYVDKSHAPMKKNELIQVVEKKKKKKEVKEDLK